MILQLLIDTPDDDELHYTRQAAALKEYQERVNQNNSMERFGTRTDDIGCTRGPNIFIATNGVRITEQRLK